MQQRRQVRAVQVQCPASWITMPRSLDYSSRSLRLRKVGQSRNQLPTPQGRVLLLTWWYTEGQAHCLPLIDVWILAQDHHSHLQQNMMHFPVRQDAAPTLLCCCAGDCTCQSSALAAPCPRLLSSACLHTHGIKHTSLRNWLFG